MLPLLACATLSQGGCPGLNPPALQAAPARSHFPDESKIRGYG